MFWNTFQIERTVIFKRQLTWVSLGILALLVMAFFGAIYSVTQTGGDVPPEIVEEIKHDLTWVGGGLNMAVSMAAGANMGGLITIIIVGAVTAQAYSWRVVQQWLSRGVSRSVLLLAKFAAVILVVLTVVTTTLLAGGIATGWMSIKFTGQLGLAGVEWTAVLKSIILTTYTLLPYATLTFLIAIVTRSTVAAVGGGLAFTLLLEGVLVQIMSLLNEQIARVSLYLPSGLTRSLLVNNGINMGFSGSGELADLIDLLPPETAAVGIALYTITFVLLATVAFHRQDLNS